MLIVQKYGGTSVGTPERIRSVARRVVASGRSGAELVVVVSAMGATTDALVRLAEQVAGQRPARSHPREMDMLLTAGERITMALLAMAVRELGAEAVSLTGSQAAIITDEAHTAARIAEVRAERVRRALDEGRIVIVAGFQGVSRAREITTLGRGGSDTTAVALAAALGAERCEIYTDVDGVHTADPRLVPAARRVVALSHPEMIELAASGARVMHPRAVELGMRWGVDIRVLSSFHAPPEGEAGGTLITREPPRMEGFVLTGIASRRDQAKLVLRRLSPGSAAPTDVLCRLADAGVSVDLVSEVRDADGRVQLELTLAEEVVDEAREVCIRAARDHGGDERVEVVRGLSRIALVGSGMHDRPGVYARSFRALHEIGVDVHAVSSSAISITLLVGAAREQESLQALHRAFELELQGAVPVRGDPQAPGVGD